MHLLDRARRKLRTLTGRTAGGDLDDKLAAYLNFRDAFFVEAGANDGVDHSTTYSLEKRRGWRGLLIEPIPELARRCAANRRRSIVEN